MSRSPAASLAIAALALGACAASVEAPRDVTAGGAADAEAAAATAAVRDAAHPLTGADDDLDALLALAGDARVVLLGESTHGTREFYAQRARLTRRLIEAHGFRAVAVEGDWPASFAVNAYVRALPGAPTSAERALAGFDAFPTWMWGNVEVRDLVTWLRERNAARPAADAVGFYDLDVYSVFTSMPPVLAYLARVAPEGARAARVHYGCFAAAGEDPQRYGAATGGREEGSCAAAARAVADTVRAAVARDATGTSAEERLSAVRNAEAVVHGEAYFRTLYAAGGSTASWNVRDRGMAATLTALEAHVAATTGGVGKVVVWAHNTHVGDARATAMGAQGELSLGQLARERLGADAVLVGFLTHAGTVLAASRWGEAARVREVRPALAGSVADVLHDTGLAAFTLDLRGGGAAAEALGRERLQRAIGVVYRPETERQSHYFQARLAAQFDAVVFLDRTRAVTPLAR